MQQVQLEAARYYGHPGSGVAWGNVGLGMRSRERKKGRAMGDRMWHCSPATVAELGGGAALVLRRGTGAAVECEVMLARRAVAVSNGNSGGDCS